MNNAGSVLITVLSIFILFLLVISMLMFAIFPISHIADTTDYEFTIDFDNGSILSYEEMSGNDYYLKYRKHEGKNYIVIAYSTSMVKEYYYSFQLSKPVICLVYETSYNFESESAFKTWYYQNNLLPLNKSQFIYGCILPPSYYKPLNNTDYINLDNFTVFDYFIENGRFPYYYEINTVNFDSYSIYRDGKPTINFANNTDKSYTVLLNSYNLFSSSVYTFQEGIDNLDFPRLNWSYGGISDLLTLFTSLTDYIDSLIAYLSNIISSFLYGFSPLLWYK